MPVASSDSPPRTGILVMVALGFLPFLHAAAVVGLGVASLVSGPLVSGRLRLAGLSVVVLYLLPPLMVRIAGWVRQPVAGLHAPGSRQFVTWWFQLQWQVLFLRLPFLEELLRLVPGLYSAWLRLWGARVGRLVYWGPELRILDRQWVQVGDRVVFGVAARLHPHVLSEDEHGSRSLFLAPVIIGADCLVGGLSTLPPSSRVPDGTVTAGGRVVTRYMETPQPWKSHS